MLRILIASASVREVLSAIKCAILRVARAAASSSVCAEARVNRVSLFSSIGSGRRRFLTTVSSTSTSPGISRPQTETSPSPIAACKSPSPNSAPGTLTGSHRVLPAVIILQSILPPWLSGVPQEMASPAGATPITPTIGLSGTRTLPGSMAWSFSMGTIVTFGASSSSPITPSCGAVTITACWLLRVMRLMVTLSASPGSAPST